MKDLEKYSQTLGEDSCYANRPSVFFFVFVFACFTDTVLFGTNGNSAVVAFQRYMVIGIAGILLVKTMYVKPMIREISLRNFFAIVAIFFIVITMLFIGTPFKRYYHMTVISCLIIGVSFSKLCSLDEFAQKYIRILTFIACFSLIVYVFRNQLANISAIPTLTNSAGYTYKTLLFSNIPLGYNHRIRNEGPYWEAGTYQAYLNIALMLTLFFDKTRYKAHRVVIFTVTLITTLSGAALIPMVLTLSAYLLSSNNRERNQKILIVFVALVIVAVAYYTGFIDGMISKVTSGTESSSFSYRWTSFYSDITSFFKSPLIGTAPEVLDVRRNQIGLIYGVKNVGVSNTFAGWFAYFGFSVGLLMTVEYWKLAKRISSDIISRTFLFLAFVAMTSNENLTASPLFFVLPFLLNTAVFENGYIGGYTRVRLFRNR